jgi:hypothetical protein
MEESIVGFVTPTGTPMERTPVLPHTLIGGVNQLMVVAPIMLRYIKEERGWGTRDEVRRDLTLSHISLIQSIRHSSGRKLHTIIVHATTTLDTPAFIRFGAIPLHRVDAVEDLLPLHRQVPLRWL